MLVPQCSVCQHEHREEIDRLLVAGSPTVPALSRTYGLSDDALLRHKARHLPIVEADSGEALWADICAVQQKLMKTLDDAQADGQRGIVVSAGRELIRLLTLRAQMIRPMLVPAEYEGLVARLGEMMGHDPVTFVQEFRERLAADGFIVPRLPRGD